MAKYIVTDGAQATGLPCPTKELAAYRLIGEVSGALNRGDDPTVYHIEEIPDEPEQPKDVPELIPDYDAACDYLEGCSEVQGDFIDDLDRQNDAFTQLLTLCKAWNKADGFEPKFCTSQKRWYPYVVGEGVIEFHETHKCGIDVTFQSYATGTPFCFKTKERARQFGEKFIDLFKKLYDIKEGE